MDVMKGLGSLLMLPVRGARAGGQAIIDIFDKDGPKSEITDRDFDEWARRIDEQKLAEFAATQQPSPNFDNMAPRNPEIYGTGDRDFQGKSDDRFMSMQEAAEIEAKAQRFRNRLYTADIIGDQLSARSEGKRRDEEIMIQKLMAMIEAQKALQAQLGLGRMQQGQQGQGGGFGNTIPTATVAGQNGGGY